MGVADPVRDPETCDSPATLLPRGNPFRAPRSASPPPQGCSLGDPHGETARLSPRPASARAKGEGRCSAAATSGRAGGGGSASSSPRPEAATTGGRGPEVGGCGLPLLPGRGEMGGGVRLPLSLRSRNSAASSSIWMFSHTWAAVAILPVVVVVTAAAPSYCWCCSGPLLPASSRRQRRPSYLVLRGGSSVCVCLPHLSLTGSAQPGPLPADWSAQAPPCPQRTFHWGEKTRDARHWPRPAAGARAWLASFVRKPASAVARGPQLLVGSGRHESSAQTPSDRFIGLALSKHALRSAARSTALFHLGARPVGRDFRRNAHLAHDRPRCACPWLLASRIGQGAPKCRPFPQVLLC